MTERDEAVAAAAELVRRLSAPSVPGGIAGRLRALVDELPPVASRFTDEERAAFDRGAGDIDARGTHPFRGTASPVAAAVRPIEGGMVVRFDVRHEGVPGHAHGSFVAGFFDVALGLVAIQAGGVGLTTQLDVRYLRPTPLDVDVAYVGEVVETGARTLVRGTARVGDEDLATAELRFLHRR